MPGYTDGVVILSVFQQADASALFRADSDPEHRRRFDFPVDFKPSLRHSEGVISRWEAERVARQRFPYAVRAADTGELLGGVELRPLADGTANLSYWTYPEHRRRRVASRAVALVCRAAFLEFKFRRLRVLVDVDNTASRRVAVLNGFREVGLHEEQVWYVLDSPD